MSAAEAPRLLAAGSWRDVPGRIAALWRRSLQFRTVLITLGLSGLAILVIGLYISFSVASGLFQTQRDRVLEASNNATAAAQSILDSSDASDRASLRLFLDAASPDDLGDPATDVSAALLTAVSAFEHEGREGRRAVLVVSDGESGEGHALLQVLVRHDFGRHREIIVAPVVIRMRMRVDDRRHR